MSEGNRFAQFAPQENRFAQFAPQGQPGAVRARIEAALARGVSPEAEARRQRADAVAAEQSGLAFYDRPQDALAAQMRPSRAHAMVAGAAQGLTFGFADEIAAGARSLGAAFDPEETVPQRYERERTGQRALLDASRRDYPVSAFASELGGAVMVPVGGAIGGATLPARIARGAGAGAVAGGIYGAGASEADTARGVVGDALRGAAIGGAVGAAVPAVSRALRNQSQRAAQRTATRESARTAPTADELRGQASALYDRASARGVVVRGDNFEQFGSGLAAQIRDAGVDPDITPAASAALRRVSALVERGDDVSLRDLDTLRRVMGNASTSNNPNDRRLAGMMIEALDDYMVGLSDDALRAGRAEGLGAELAEARSLWARLRRSERIDEAITRAGDAASGFENGLRVEFRRLLRDGRFMRSISAAERDAIRSVVRGTPMGNFLRVIAGWGGGRDIQRNLLNATTGAGLGGAAGAALFGPLGAAVGAATPIVAGRAAAGRSERMTADAARLAQSLVARGGLSPEATLALQSVPRNALADFLERSPAAYYPSGEPVARTIMGPRQ